MMEMHNTNKMISFLVFLISFTCILNAQKSDLELLQNEIKRLEQISGGTVGVGIIHLENHTQLMFNNDQTFPMASCFKVPVAIRLLQRVEEGTLTLDSMINVTARDIHPGSGTISRLLDDPGVSLSVLNLLELMMLISDNSAADLCLELSGGPVGVNEMLHSNHIEGLSVDRPTLALIANWLGAPVAAEQKMTMDEFREVVKAVNEVQQEESMENFSNDPRDQSSPGAMALLLQLLWNGQLLNKEYTDLLLDIMYRCETGELRIKGILPPDIRVAHKTGTIGKTANDVGIIDLPDDAGHVIVTIFVKDSAMDVADREKSIAHIARAVYDYFLFHKTE